MTISLVCSAFILGSVVSLLTPPQTLGWSISSDYLEDAILVNHIHKRAAPVKSKYVWVSIDPLVHPDSKKVNSNSKSATPLAKLNVVPTNKDSPQSVNQAKITSASLKIPPTTEIPRQLRNRDSTPQPALVALSEREVSKNQTQNEVNGTLETKAAVASQNQNQSMPSNLDGSAPPPPSSAPTAAAAATPSDKLPQSKLKLKSIISTTLPPPPSPPPKIKVKGNSNHGTKTEPKPPPPPGPDKVKDTKPAPKKPAPPKPVETKSVIAQPAGGRSIAKKSQPTPPKPTNTNTVPTNTNTTANAKSGNGSAVARAKSGVGGSVIATAQVSQGGTAQASAKSLGSGGKNKVAMAVAQSGQGGQIRAEAGTDNVDVVGEVETNSEEEFFKGKRTTLPPSG